MTHGWKEISDRRENFFSVDTRFLTQENKETIQEESSATLEFAFQWKSLHASHTDCFFAKDVDFMRDPLPGSMLSAFMGKTAEDLLFFSGASNMFVTPYDPGSELCVDQSQLDMQHTAMSGTGPHFGRFYPKEIIKEPKRIAGVGFTFFRCTGVEPDRFLADFNHPLSGENINLSVFIHDVRRKSGVQGGPRTDWLAVTTSGPGMQARCHGMPTDFFADSPFSRADESDDRLFYEESRLISHMDKRAESIIAGIYGNFLRDGMKVLDLMSSWQSHIPGYLNLDSLTGLGMNVEEMSLNLQLTDQIVHDLNHTSRLPFDNGEFDTVVCTVSAEYLTRPFEVFEDVARILRPGGHFLVTFSNRWVPSKAVRVWTELMEFERIGLVLEYFLKAGNFRNLETFSIRGLPRPESDKYYPEMPFSDPVYAVWGQKA